MTNEHLSFSWTGTRPLRGREYLVAGTVLMIVKLALDWSITQFVFHRPWSPWFYLFWPIQEQGIWTGYQSDPTAQTQAVVLLLLSLPFAWIGVLLTWRRLRDAALPGWWVLFFFVPVLNVLFFVLLCLARSHAAAPIEAHGAAERVLALQGRRTTAPFNRRSAAKALATSIPLTIVAVVFGVTILETYGLGVFVGAPFLLGFITAAIVNADGTQTLGSCVSTAMSAVTIVGLCFLLIAVEGIICLAMAAPIAYPLAWLGACIGYAITRRGDQVPERYLVLALGFALPTLMAAEYAVEPEPPLWEVRTTVEIDAPPAVVWRNVLAFPPLPEPTDWLFGTGVAYPQRAEIHGSGVGAVRHCVFSTGAFVEPIDVWDEPRLLQFRVTEQPPPMREWSPYDIHPPHLDHYLVSRRGEFRLTPLEGGRTRLDGTTWYQNRMWPAGYWRLWSDFIIHRIHGRVLEHIRVLSEEG